MGSVHRLINKQLWFLLLTVDGDVDGLNICVDIVDSCALVRPGSLPGDGWDFQVLIV